MSERDRSKERSESDTIDQRANKREQEECVRWRWRTAAKAKVKSKFGMSKEVLSLQLNKSQQSYDGRRHSDVARTSEPLNRYRYRYNCRCRRCVRHYR